MALLGWLIGFPLLLLGWGGWPLSDAPGWGFVEDLPLPKAVDQGLIGIISVAVWGTWGQFAYGVVAEMTALVRRRERSGDAEQTDDVIRRFAAYMVEAVSQDPSPLARYTRPPEPAATPPPETDADADEPEPAPAKSPTPSPNRSKSKTKHRAKPRTQADAPPAPAPASAAEPADDEAPAELETIAASLVTAETGVDSWRDPTTPWQWSRPAAEPAVARHAEADAPVTTSRRKARPAARHAAAETAASVDTERPPRPGRRIGRKGAVHHGGAGDIGPDVLLPRPPAPAPAPPPEPDEPEAPADPDDFHDLPEDIEPVEVESFRPVGRRTEPEPEDVDLDDEQDEQHDDELDDDELDDDVPAVPTAAMPVNPGEPTDTRGVLAPGEEVAGRFGPATPRSAPGQEAGAVRRLEDILHEVDVLVRVLGEVEAVRPSLHTASASTNTSASADEQVLPARQKALEALVYLALSDVGVSRKELERVLFPTGPASERVLYNTIKSVLKVVGDHQPGATTGRHFVLSERVVTDYGIFCDLAAEGERAADAEHPELAATLLGDALELVRGEPFTGISRGYTWAAAHRATMVAQVVDVSERLAAVHMASGDWRAAEDAARQGLLASPGDERLEDLISHVAGRS